MTILIEDSETLEFLAVNNQWTKKPGQAVCFPSTRAAFSVAKGEPIGKFNIVQHLSFNQQLINLDHGSGKGKGPRVEPSKVSEGRLPEDGRRSVSSAG
ncbi:MAG: hypothetical protein ACLQVY_15590 [Limisphaerales bacterium]